MYEQYQKTLAASASEGTGFSSYPVSFPESTGYKDDGAFQVLVSGVSGYLKGFTKTIRDKRRMVLALVMMILWVVPILIGRFSSLPAWIDKLNYFTFAAGGLTGGLSGMVGGIAGRGMVAYFFASLFMPLFHKNLPLSGMYRGIKAFFRTLWVKDLRSLGSILFGIGLGLALFNFFTGDFSFQNSIIGVYGALLMLSSLGNDRGFITRFINGFSKKKNRIVRGGLNVTTGLALGFLGAIPLSLPDGLYLGYITGVAMAVVGLILLIFFKKQKVEGVS